MADCLPSRCLEYLVQQVEVVEGGRVFYRLYEVGCGGVLRFGGEGGGERVGLALIK